MKKLIRLLLCVSLVCLGLLILMKTIQATTTLESQPNQETNARLLFNPLYTHVALLRGVQ